jgi:hypothetical protein
VGGHLGRVRVVGHRHEPGDRVLEAGRRALLGLAAADVGLDLLEEVDVSG